MANGTRAEGINFDARHDIDTSKCREHSECFLEQNVLELPNES